MTCLPNLARSAPYTLHDAKWASPPVCEVILCIWTDTFPLDTMCLMSVPVCCEPSVFTRVRGTHVWFLQCLRYASSWWKNMMIERGESWTLQDVPRMAALATCVILDHIPNVSSLSCRSLPGAHSCFTVNLMYASLSHYFTSSTVSPKIWSTRTELPREQAKLSSCCTDMHMLS